MAVSRLPSEILDKVFAELSPIRRSWVYIPVVRNKRQLMSVSLVCSAWRGPAQRRLRCVLRLTSTDDLRKIASYGSRDLEGNCKILVLRLCDSSISPKLRLHSHMLEEHAALFANIQELHVETHNTEDDPMLANLIRRCKSLRVLLVEHALASVEYESEDEDESDFSDSSWEDREIKYTTASVATFPSLLASAIPFLPCLRHLALARLDLGKVPDVSISLQGNLQNVALSRSSCPRESLALLLHESHRLQQISIIQPDNTTEEDLISLLTPHTPRLKLLSITFPWKDHVYPPEQADKGAKLSGVVQPLLLTCEQLEVLYCQDTALDLSALHSLTHLETVVPTVDNIQTLQLYLEQEERRSQIYFDVHILGPPRPHPSDVDAAIAKWQSQGLDIRHGALHTVNTRALAYFTAILPDPISD